jgi:hypothetical protein
MKYSSTASGAALSDLKRAKNPRVTAIVKIAHANATAAMCSGLAGVPAAARASSVTAAFLCHLPCRNAVLRDIGRLGLGGTIRIANDAFNLVVLYVASMCEDDQFAQQTEGEQL